MLESLSPTSWLLLSSCKERVRCTLKFLIQQLSKFIFWSISRSSWLSCWNISLSSRFQIVLYSNRYTTYLVSQNFKVFLTKTIENEQRRTVVLAQNFRAEGQKNFIKNVRPCYKTNGNSCAQLASTLQVSHLRYFRRLAPTPFYCLYKNSK